MNEHSTPQNEFIDLALLVCGKTLRALLLKICIALKASDNSDSLEEVLARLPVSANSDLYFLLETCLQIGQLSMKWSEIGWSLETAALVHEKHNISEKTEIVWTGPSTGSYPIRRTDQVLYDLILNAENRIMLVTFAAAKIERLNTALADASKRGIRICLILEFDEESEGQLTKSAIDAFAGSVEHAAETYYWPLNKRERNAYGMPGKLHAKCAVIDNSILISSANLTDAAFNRNMELGVLIQGGSIPEQISRYIEDLMRCGILVPWK
jgi:cardiolipin synthase A/B